MKSVTIPTCANPFVVVVNGVKYFYPAGETVEVPDDVAAVIEEHNEAHNNPSPAPVVPPFVPSGGGVSVEEVEAALAKSGQIGYIGKKKNVVFPQATLNFTDSTQRCNVDFLPLINGEEYTVVFDRAEYKCIAYVDMVGNARLGNLNIGEDGVDTGEPFYYFHFEGLEAYFRATTPGNHTIEIYTEEDVIVPIDPKFLPESGGGGGGSIPLVELTTPLATGVTLTDEENALLSAVYDSEAPVAVIKAPFVWGTSWTWDNAFIVEKGLLTEGWVLLIAQVGTMKGGNYRIEFSRTNSTGVWSVTLTRYAEQSGVTVKVLQNTASTSGAQSAELSAELTEAYNSGLPVIIKFGNVTDPGSGMPIGDVSYMFQRSTANNKMVSCGNNIVLTKSSNTWSCTQFQ